MRKFIFALGMLFILSSCLCAAESPVRTVIGWDFDASSGFRGWMPNGHLADVKTGAEGMSAKVVDWDPYITSPVFDIPANPWQWIEIRMKCNRPGDGQIFWSNTLESPYGGFLPDKYTPFTINSAGWKTLIIRPFWQTEKKIVHMRIDMFQGAEFTIKSIKILEPASKPGQNNTYAWNFASNANWYTLDGSPVSKLATGIAMNIGENRSMLQSPMLSVPVKDRTWAAVRMKSSKGGKAFLHWATDAISGLQATSFVTRGDSRFHTYNIDLGSSLGWSGNLLMLGLTPSLTSGDRVEIKSVTLEKDMVGGPDLNLDYFGMENAVNRAGKPCILMARFTNQGSKTAVGVKAKVTAPKGVSIRQTEAPAEFDPLMPGTFRFELVSEVPVKGDVTIHLSGPGAPDYPFKASVNITKSPVVAKTGYVPEIKPAKTDYQIGMYYFPGWDTPGKWEPISRVAPIRKPLLGWYDESNPEVADWQIKWAAEHGISFFLVDWYWCQGNRMLDHWLHNAYGKSRYRNQLKWAVMWANHNPPETHSLEDWRNVTRYWIDNYFGMDEYLRIDGKPAVYIWSPSTIRKGMGGSEEAAKLLAMSQQMAKDAGYPGITFIAMNEATVSSAAKELKSEGYVGYTEYHWWADSMSLAKDPNFYPFSLVVDRSKKAWEERAKILNDAGLAFQPIADTGWDARPWHGDRSFVMHDRTVPEFERLLREAKSYLDARNEKMLVLGPCNEWGEGSYTEPCTEFGFGMYDAVRRVFCKDEPHEDIAPVDVGMGPYDMQAPGTDNRTVWKFDNAGDSEGWFSMMNLTNVEVKDGSLFSSTTGVDPAFNGPTMMVRAAKYPYVIIRMKIGHLDNEKEQLQLFWSTPTMGTSEANSVRADVIGDGQFHMYVLPVYTNPRWRGFIRGFRLDPCSTNNTTVWVDEIRLAEKKP